EVRGGVAPAVEPRPIGRSCTQRLPGAPQRFRQSLPLFPLAASRFPLADYDLVLSTSHCVAVGARVGPGACHVAYSFTPMRYAWDQQEEDVRRLPVGTRWLGRPVLAAPRRWGRAAGRGGRGGGGRRGSPAGLPPPRGGARPPGGGGGGRVLLPAGAHRVVPARRRAGRGVPVRLGARPLQAPRRRGRRLHPPGLAA